MSFAGGKLKLKGALGRSSGGVKKVKKKKKKVKDTERDNLAGSLEAIGSEGLEETPEGFKLPQPRPDEDRRTEAERVYDEKMNKREEEQIRRLAVKSHRERVKDFNEYLAKLTEHHDIPKVGPG